MMKFIEYLKLLNRKHVKLKSQNGIALLMAIMIVALVSIISVNMLSQRQLQIYRTSNLYFREQAYQFSLGIERWGLSVLSQDFEEGKKSSKGNNAQYDSNQDIWNTALVNFDVEQATISGVIFDLQGRLNLNNLVVKGRVNVKWLESYKRLLKALDLPSSLAITLLDWMDNNEQPTGSDGAEDVYYIALDEPYRAANQPLTHVSELLLIKGYTPAVIDTLKPYVFAAAEVTAVNVNISSIPVLQAVIPGITESQAESIISEIETSPFTSVADFMKNPDLKNKPIDMSQIGISSYYFSVNSYVTIDKTHVNLQSIINRDKLGNVSVQSRQESLWYEKSIVQDTTE